MPTANFSRIALILSAAVFATLLGLGMMVPALPTLQKTIGMTDLQAGMMLACFGFARVIFNAPSGYAVDRWGVLPVAGLGITLIALGGVTGAFTGSFEGAAASFMLQGAGSAAFATAALTTMLLAAGPARRGLAMSYFQTAVLLSFAAGPVLGGQTIGPFGPHAAFWVTVGLSLLISPTLIYMRHLLRSSTPAAPAAVPSAAPAGPRRRSGLIRRPLVLAALVGFAAYFSRVGFAWYVLPQAAIGEFDLGPRTVGLIVGFGTAANLVIMPLIGGGIDRIGPRTVLIGACVLAVLGLATPVLWPTEAGLWVATALAMMGTGAMIPAASALALTGSHPSETGRVMGLFRTVSDLGMALGPLLIPAAAMRLALEGEDDSLVTAAACVVGLALALIPLRPKAGGAGPVPA